MSRALSRDGVGEAVEGGSADATVDGFRTYTIESLRSGLFIICDSRNLLSSSEHGISAWRGFSGKAISFPIFF